MNGINIYVSNTGYVRLTNNGKTMDDLYINKSSVSDVNYLLKVLGKYTREILC